MSVLIVGLVYYGRDIGLIYCNMKKRIEVMDEKEYKKLKSRIYFSVRKYFGESLDPEDAAHQIFLTWLSKRKESKQTIDHAVIDYARRTLGDSRTKSHNQRRSINMAVSDGLERVESPTRQYDANVQWLARILPRVERIVFLLRIKWGFNEAEIADLYNVSESRISQIYKGIQERLSKRVKQEAKKHKKTKSQLEEILQTKNERDWWKVESFKDQTMEAGKSW